VNVLEVYALWLLIANVLAKRNEIIIDRSSGLVSLRIIFLPSFPVDYRKSSPPYSCGTAQDLHLFPKIIL